MARYGLHVPSFSSHASYVPVDIKKHRPRTWSCLWYFSTHLTWLTFRIMANKGIPMLCEDAPSQMPTLYICPVTNVLGRIPLIPCYMDGQTHAIIPHRFRTSQLGGAMADTRPDNGTGSSLYELNLWMWRYGRSLPRNMSVADSDKIRHKRMLESRTKGAETKRREARDGEQTWLNLCSETLRTM